MKKKKIKLKVKDSISLVFLVSFVLFIFYCAGSEVSIVVKHPNDGKIFIDGNSIDNYVKRSRFFTKEEALFFLSLDSGNYLFKFVFVDSTEIDTLISVHGETYLGVDLKEKRLSGM